MRFWQGVIGCSAAILVLVAQAQAQPPRPFTAEDLVRLNRVSDPQVSPDGRRLVFTMRETDLEADKGRTDLWLLDLTDDDAKPRQLTADPANDGNPRWSADGRAIYFLSGRSDTSQVWRLALGAGEAVQVTDLPLAVSNLVVSPAGDRLAFTMEVFPDCGDLACTRDRLVAAAESKVSAQVYDKLFMRHWDVWKDGRRSHLFSQALDGNGMATGKPVGLTRALDGDTPSKPFGGTEEIAFSPDGATLYFTLREAGRSEAWSTNLDIFMVPADGSAAPENLTDDNDAVDTTPAVSPDGRWLGWLAMARPMFEADRLVLKLRDLKTGETRALTQDWDRSISSWAFAPNGRSVFATAQHIGQRPLWRIDVNSGEVQQLTESGQVSGFAVTKDRVIFARNDITGPADLFSVGHSGRGLQRRTAVNADRLSGIAMGEHEQFSFAGWNDETVYGHVVKPWNFEEGRKYPVAFLIHGGPQGSFGNFFHYRWNYQTYAGQGLAVVFIDFHGSTGYGQAFTDSISGDWGGKPLVDLQKGLAAALERYPWLDGTEVCALGASYGGYMINWIAGQWPDRFKCLVNHDGVFDNRMMYYTTEELWFPEWEHGGPYFASPASHEKHNPALHVENWRAPMLVIHGSLDYRVPETQGIAAFTALQRRGIESRYVLFPDENHWVLSPANSVAWHSEVNAWLARYLGPNSKD